MIRLSRCVIALLIATALTSCKTDSQLMSDGASAYVAANPALDRATATAIAANRLRNGMTMEQVTAAWGEPVVVQRFSDNTEYWMFGCHWPHHCGGGSRDEPPEARYESRATFKDGKLISWRD